MIQNVDLPVNQVILEWPESVANAAGKAVLPDGSINDMPFTTLAEW